MAKEKKDPAEKKGPPPEKGGKEKGAKEKGAKGAPAADKGAPAAPQKPASPPRLALRYKQEIVPALQKRLGRANALSLPKLQKISVKMSVGKAPQDSDGS